LGDITIFNSNVIIKDGYTVNKKKTVLIVKSSKL